MQETVFGWLVGWLVSWLVDLVRAEDKCVDTSVGEMHRNVKLEGMEVGKKNEEEEEERSRAK
jgi:hypothetical protein